MNRSKLESHVGSLNSVGEGFKKGAINVAIGTAIIVGTVLVAGSIFNVLNNPFSVR